MKTLVVYESAWGNTKAVAQAVAAGLPGQAATEVVDVQQAPPLERLAVALLAVGAPTHAFGLSRAETREEAHQRGGTPPTTGLREWLDATGACTCLSPRSTPTCATPTCPARLAARPLSA